MSPEELHRYCHDFVCNGDRSMPRGATGVSCSCRGRDAAYQVAERLKSEVESLTSEVARLREERAALVVVAQKHGVPLFKTKPLSDSFDMMLNASQETIKAVVSRAEAAERDRDDWERTHAALARQAQQLEADREYNAELCRELTAKVEAAERARDEAVRREADAHDIISGYEAITDPEQHPELFARSNRLLGADSGDCGNPICKHISDLTARLTAAEAALQARDEVNHG